MPRSRALPASRPPEPTMRSRARSFPYRRSRSAVRTRPSRLSTPTPYDLARRGPEPVERSARERLVDLLARGADRELLGVAPRSPLLAAQCAHRLAGDGRLEDLVLLHVVREALVISGLDVLFADELFELSVEGGQTALVRAFERG